MPRPRFPVLIAMFGIGLVVVAMLGPFGGAQALGRQFLLPGWAQSVLLAGVGLGLTLTAGRMAWREFRRPNRVISRAEQTLSVQAGDVFPLVTLPAPGAELLHVRLLGVRCPSRVRLTGEVQLQSDGPADQFSSVGSIGSMHRAARQVRTRVLGTLVEDEGVTELEVEAPLRRGLGGVVQLRVALVESDGPPPQELQVTIETSLLGRA
ncbi:MAG: hypothetical protein SFZ23_08910 [Planctomycetota bacterium]|nr:hypothetical protein [Planctomycetota bacterium]